MQVFPALFLAVAACYCCCCGVDALTREPLTENPQDTHNELELVAMHRATNMIGASKNNNNGISISASTTKMATSGWITVSWDGVLQPTKEDWIGVFTSPLDLSLTPVKYRACDVSKTHMVSGKGDMKMFLLNMRHDVVFVYFTNGTSYPIAIAASASLSFANPNEPMQGHIAIGDDISTMRVMWTTRDVGTPVLMYGLTSDALTTRVNATSTTYKKEEMCGAPANETGWMSPGTFHSALITNMKPRTRYYYTYGDNEGGFASVASFVSPPTPGDQTSFTFLAFGDMGQTEIDGSEEQSYMSPSINTTRLMAVDAANGAELVVHIGDISYARGYSSQWDVFMHQISDGLARNLPYMTAIGNHERDFPSSGGLFNGTDSGGECGVAYERRMQMPTPAPDQPWYSFEYGSVHFLLISTEHDFAKGSPQYTYIVNDLSKVNRTRTPWLIVGGHRPMYIDSTNNDAGDGDLTVGRELRRVYEGLFLKYQVDLFLGAHHHSYQRSCPLDRRVCLGYRRDGSARAPIYMVIGMAGAGSCTNVHRLQTWFIERRDVVNYGYTRTHVNGTHLTMEFVADVDGSVLDTFTLVQPKDRIAAMDEEEGQIFPELGDE